MNKSTYLKTSIKELREFQDKIQAKFNNEELTDEQAESLKNIWQRKENNINYLQKELDAHMCYLHKLGEL